MDKSIKFFKQIELNFYEIFKIRVITKLPNSEQSYKGKVRKHLKLHAIKT
jgi:hypothetical protein